MNVIQKLDHSVVEDIRSSFTIYSQAQALEEIVLNSTDAGATIIEIHVNPSSFSFEVRDNGVGMSREDLILCGERYATSKCSGLKDLSRITTSGFRGESIASIASVSHVTITTRPPSSHQTLAKCVQGGNVLSLGPASTPRAVGTTVEVKDLFYKCPVRQKSTSVAQELEDIKQRVEGIILSHPETSFTLYDKAKGTRVLQYKKTNSLLGCFTQLFGTQKAEGLSEVGTTATEVSCSGYVSSAGAEGHHSKALQFLYINNRLVKRTPIHRVINRLYSTHIRERSPIFVLFVKCDPELYDICFQPDKSHVEFKDWSAVNAVVSDTINTALTYNDSPLSPSSTASDDVCMSSPQSPPTSQSHPPLIIDTKTTDKPVRRVTRASSAPPFFDRRRLRIHHNPYSSLFSKSRTFATRSSFDDSPKRSSTSQNMGVTTINIISSSKKRKHTNNDSDGGDKHRHKTANDDDDNNNNNSSSSSKNKNTIINIQRGSNGIYYNSSNKSNTNTNTNNNPNNNKHSKDCDESGPLSRFATVTHNLSIHARIANAPVTSAEQVSSDVLQTISKDMIKKMRVVGQMDKKFIVTQVGSQLYVIDQHAADERVRLERLEVTVSGSTGTERNADYLIFDNEQSWSLSPHEIQAMSRYESLLIAWGFKWKTRVSDNSDGSQGNDNSSVSFWQIPKIFDVPLNMEDLREYLVQLEETKGSAITRPRAITRILNSKACRGAIMFGDSLSFEECVLLVEQLSLCKLPFQCAHGRPSMYPLLNLHATSSIMDDVHRNKRRRGLGALVPPSLLKNIE